MYILSVEFTVLVKLAYLPGFNEDICVVRTRQQCDLSHVL